MNRSVSDFDSAEANAINDRLDRMTEANLKRAVEEPATAERMAKLDREWELERAILLAFAAMGGVALGLGLRRNWRWRFPLTAQIAAMTMQAAFGWSPQAAVLLRLGFRTRREIEAERSGILAGLQG